MTRRSTTLINPLAGHVGFHLRRASAAVMADLAGQLAEIALRPAEASALMLIAANPGVTQSKVGRALGIQRANMAPMVARLAERGLIAGAPVDGRSTGLSLTAEGSAIAAQARSRMEQHDARFMGDIPPGERDALIARLAAVAKTRTV